MTEQIVSVGKAKIWRGHAVTDGEGYNLEGTCCNRWGGVQLGGDKL